MTSPREIAEGMKAEIVSDVKSGVVPRDVSGFAELHNYVDANCYGGAEQLFGEMVTESATDHEHQEKLDRLNAILKPAIDIVDAWIKAGGIETALTLERRSATSNGMRITVYRPREPDGLGPPQAFLGDEHPTEGDWVQSAKHEMKAGEYRPLLMLGRAFLIYSMYHAREPRFLGYAIENFGAAVRKIGYTLPLGDADATWRPYSSEELDPPSRPHDYQFMLGQIATVFGVDAAKAQADAIQVQWPARVIRHPHGDRGR